MLLDSVIEGHLSEPLPETVIWRYMNFAKFMSLIHDKSLFFPLANTIIDKFDGSLAMIGPDVRRVYTSLGPMFLPVPNREDWLNDVRNSCSISCWHKNNEESAAMWELYGNRNMGIAIRSTYQHLIESADFEKYGQFTKGNIN